jgi:hypothetical protein
MSVDEQYGFSSKAVIELAGRRIDAFLLAGRWDVRMAAWLIGIGFHRPTSSMTSRVISLRHMGSRLKKRWSVSSRIMKSDGTSPFAIGFSSSVEPSRVGE